MDAEATAPEALAVNVEQRGDATVISISGEIDLFCLPTVRRAVSEAPRGALTLNLADVTFIDVAGVEYLLELSQAARQQGAAFRLDGPSARVRRVIELLGLQTQLA